MPAITSQHVRKAFGSRVVLEDATVTVARGERVGLIGANGSGKSTFAKILAGVDLPDGGTVSVRRGLSVRYLAQEPELDPRASAAQVVEEALSAWTAATSRHAAVTADLAAGGQTASADLLGEQATLGETIEQLGGWSRGHEALGFLDRLGVRDVQRPCGERSGGERRRIALAQLLVASPDVAILDEPTNHLDAATAEWLEGHLSDAFRGAIVLVTHDRYFLDAIAQRIVEVERGRLTAYSGGYGAYLEKKAELLSHEERVEQNRQNLLRREREWLSRGPRARSTKQKARIARAAELEARPSATAGRPRDVTLLEGASARQGKTILELRGLQVEAGTSGPLNLPFDLVLGQGDRIGIVGPNGVGKTTLVSAVLAACEGQREQEPPAPPFAGEIVVGKNTRVAYLDQARAGLDDDKSIFDDVRGEGGATMVTLGPGGRDAMDLRSYLELFLFDVQKQRQSVGSLSGGERARVALAKVLRQGANLLVFDEPTNDLDLQTLSALEDLLERYEGAVLVVTHDRAFLDNVATAILAFEPTGPAAPARVTRYAGGYQDYVLQRDRAAAAPAGAPTTASTRPVAMARSKSGGLTYAERLELDGIVDAIDAAEKRVAELESALADPSLYAARGAEVTPLRSRLQAAAAEAASLVRRWEALEAKKLPPK
ncbi:MAG: ABC-F family ATP-binding cassette domain-containing protein, partial [Polyangiaceae bacterium]